MKIINRMISRTIAEIVIVIALVIASIPVWNRLELNDYKEVAMYYDNMESNYLEVSDFSDYVLHQANDIDAVNSVKPITLTIANEPNKNEEYAVWMIVSKNSTIDLDAIKINIDNDINKLTDLEMYEDETYCYFLLFEGHMSEQFTSKDVQLWIDNETKLDIANKHLQFDFKNIKRQIL